MKKAIVITGVSSGIGYALANAFARKGYRVFGSVRKPEDAQTLQTQYPDLFEPLVFDVTNHPAIDKEAARVAKLLNGSKLAGLINNAGLAVTGALLELPINDFKRQFEVNVFGLIKVTQAFLPMLGASLHTKGKPGRIINISSAAGQIGFPFMSPYCGSKHAVEGISESLRRELMHLGIKVIIVGPTAIKTPIWDKEGAEVPEESLKGLFGKQINNFIKFFAKSGKRGMPADKFASRVLAIFELNQPNVRYAISANPWTEWRMPRYLPAGMVDNKLQVALNR